MLKYIQTITLETKQSHYTTGLNDCRGTVNRTLCFAGSLQELKTTQSVDSNYRVVIVNNSFLQESVQCSDKQAFYSQLYNMRPVLGEIKIIELYFIVSFKHYRFLLITSWLLKFMANQKKDLC